jgi:hypothetical protein
MLTDSFRIDGRMGQDLRSAALSLAQQAQKQRRGAQFAAVRPLGGFGQDAEGARSKLKGHNAQFDNALGRWQRLYCM